MRWALIAAALLGAFLLGKKQGAPKAAGATWLAGDTKGLVRPSAILGWELIPGKLDVNSFGEMGPEIPMKAPHGKHRVLVIGDSYTEPASFPAALNAAAEAKKTDLEFVRGGMRGYAADTHLIWYRTYGKYLKPEVVLAFFFVGNDLGDIVRSRAYQGYQKPWFMVEDGKLAIHDFPIADPLKRFPEDQFTPLIQNELKDIQGAARALGDRTAGSKGSKAAALITAVYKVHYWLYAHFPPYRWAKDAASGYKARSDPKEEQRQLALGDLWYLRNGAYAFLKEGKDLDAAWALHSALYEELKREVEKDGGKFAVVMVPHVWQVVPETGERFLKAAADAGYKVDLDAPRTRLKEFSKRTGIPVLDPTDALRAANKEGNPYDSLYSAAHWSALGMKTVGESVVKFLEEKRWPVRK
jgi:hypothetical protein